jgi:hypothetical protein
MHKLLQTTGFLICFFYCAVVLAKSRIIDTPKNLAAHRSFSLKAQQKKVIQGLPTLLYMVAAGYSDQFRSLRGMKSKYTSPNELVVSSHTRALDEKRYIIRQKFVDWKGEPEQVDDIPIMGIKIK